MKTHQNIKKLNITRLAAILLLVLPGVYSFAQDAAPTATAAPVHESSGFSALWIMLISVMAVLLLVILLLGNVLINLVKAAIEKRKHIQAVAILFFILLSSIASAQGETPAPAVAKSPFIDWNIIMASSVLLAEVVVILIFLWQIQSWLNILSDKKKEARVINIHLPKLLDNFNASVSVEHEADVMTDHEYDGIRELDNELPPWWKYGFYLTIVYAVCYLFYFHVYGGPTSHQAYEKEMREAKIEKDEYLRKNALNVDETNVKLADAVGIEEGKTIFLNNCAACHGLKAEGNVGPNLTDDYWLHGGGLNDLFKTVKYGWPAKGMKAWGSDLSPLQIRNVISYVKSLHGTNPPNAKAPQGDLYVEASAGSTPADTTAKKN